MRQIETRHIRLSTTRLDLQYHPKRHPDRRGGTQRDRNPPKKPQRSPRAGGAEDANDGKAPARHQDGTDQHPRCVPRPNRPETAPDERGTSGSLKALINAVAEIPTFSSLHRWRPAQHHERDPRAGPRAAQARCPHRPRAARVATLGRSIPSNSEADPPSRGPRRWTNDRTRSMMTRPCSE